MKKSSDLDRHFVFTVVPVSLKNGVSGKAWLSGSKVLVPLNSVCVGHNPVGQLSESFRDTCK